MAFTIKKGDTLPKITGTLTTGPSAGSQSAVDLTDATAVVLVMKNITGGAASRKTAAFVNPRTSGQVEYVWQTADTSAAGTFNAEWEVTWTGGAVQTFPNEDYFTIVIAADLDA